MVVKNVKKDEVIIKKGVICLKLIIVIEGDILVGNQKVN
jgi:hypothetical protein